VISIATADGHDAVTHVIRRRRSDEAIGALGQVGVMLPRSERVLWLSVGEVSIDPKRDFADRTGTPRNRPPS
jgi:hypothetical protein